MYKKCLMICLCLWGMASASDRAEAFDWMKDQASRSQSSERGYGSSSSKTMVLDRTQLKQQDPALVAYLLIEALNRNYISLLPELLSIYETMPRHDVSLIQRAKAAIAWHAGKTQQALQIYEKLLDQDDNPRVRLDFAASQAYDGLRWSALQQFQRVYERTDVPEAVKVNIKRFMQALSPKWSWNLGISPIYNNNLNQATLPYCTVLGCQTPMPLKAWGLSYLASLHKLWLLPGRQMWGVDIQVDGENYDFSHQSAYNILNTRLALKWLWQDRAQQWWISPFWRLHFAAGAKWETLSHHSLSPWSSRYGLQFQYVYRLDSIWRFVGALDIYKQAYRQEHYAQRHEAWVFQEQLFVERNLPYQWRLAWSFGAVQNRPVHAYLANRLNNTAYQQVHTGLVLAKQYGRLHAQLSYWFAHRRFKGLALTEQFRLLARKDNEKRIAISLSHQALSWQGILPKIDVQYFKINSTHAWAKQKGMNVNVFLKFDRAF